MTVRALVIGFAIATFVAAFTYFNDQVIVQSYLIGNHLPPAVFGAGILLVLVVNPLLGVLGIRKLAAGEVAIAVALGLAVCAWPGSNLYRYFSGVMAKPAAVDATKPLWQGQRVMSYLPGGSALLAEGYVADWPAFADELRAASQGDPAASPVTARLVEWMGFERRIIDASQPGQNLTLDERRSLVGGINQVLQRPDFYDDETAAGLALPEDARAIAALPAASRTGPQVVALNRALVGAALPGLVRAPPTGRGLLLNDGHPHRAVDLIIAGDRDNTDWPSPADVPWGVWWPTLRLWIGASLLLGLAALCMIVVVHPQWSQRELLPYPTVKFVHEITEPADRGWLPRVAHQRLFWLGFLGVFAIHGLNGLHAWFPILPSIGLRYDLWGLGALFPNARQVSGSSGLLNPQLFFSVIGFAFFIPTNVSFSVGLSIVLWVALGATMIASGSSLDIGHFRFDANGTVMRFGAYLGFVLIIAYYGRRYYWGVLRGGLGLRHPPEVPRTSVWAARLMVLCLAGVVAVLARWGGLDPLLAAAFVAIVMVILLVLSRLNAETGLFYAQPDFFPGTMLIGFIGFAAAGPEAMLVLLLASIVFAADPREAIAPFLVNGLRMSESIGRVPLGRAARWLAASLTLGLVVATVATLSLQYDKGLNPNDTFANRYLPEASFNVVGRAIGELSATGELVDSTGRTTLQRLTAARPMPGVVPWALLGVALVIGCAAARIRLPWWPIHPVLFIVWGTYPAYQFAFSFLVAAAVKYAVVKLGGVRAYHVTKPLMIGFIAAELLAVVFWSVVGTIYYLTTGFSPVNYQIFTV